MRLFVQRSLKPPITSQAWTCAAFLLFLRPWSLVCGWAGAERYSNSAAIDGNPLLSACVKSHHLLRVSSAEITPGTQDPGPKACAPPRLLLYIIISFSPACSRWSGGEPLRAKTPLAGHDREWSPSGITNTTMEELTSGVILCPKNFSESFPESFPRVLPRVPPQVLL